MHRCEATGYTQWAPVCVYDGRNGCFRLLMITHAAHEMPTIGSTAARRGAALVLRIRMGRDRPLQETSLFTMSFSTPLPVKRHTARLCKVAPVSSSSPSSSSSSSSSPSPASLAVITDVTWLPVGVSVRFVVTSVAMMLNTLPSRMINHHIVGSDLNEAE